MDKLKIYCDFDNTIVNTVKCIVDLYNDDFKYYPNFKNVIWMDIDSWDFTECELASKDYINMLFTQPRFFRKLGFMDWSFNVLMKLKDMHDISIISLGTTPNLKQKEKWIDDMFYGLKFVGINSHVYQDKSCVNMSDGILIDDVADNLISSNAKYKICFGDEYSWNKDWNGTRCHNWHDIYYKIQELNERSTTDN